MLPGIENCALKHSNHQKYTRVQVVNVDVECQHEESVEALGASELRRAASVEKNINVN